MSEQVCKYCEEPIFQNSPISPWRHSGEGNIECVSVKATPSEPEQEVTVPANPDSATDDRLEAARKLLPYVYPNARECEKEILAECLARNTQGMVYVFYRAMDTEMALAAALREIAALKSTLAAMEGR